MCFFLVGEEKGALGFDYSSRSRMDLFDFGKEKRNCMRLDFCGKLLD